MGQPRAAEDEAESLAVALEGASPMWAGPLRVVDGRAGELRRLPQDGLVPELVGTERDSVAGETMVTVAGGGAVTVEAAGPWTLTLE